MLCWAWWRRRSRRRRSPQRNPVYATGMILPAIVAIGWSGWYAFSRIPELARLADSASLGSGGMLFVFSGPVLMIGGLAAIVATHSG